MQGDPANSHTKLRPTFISAGNSSEAHP